MNKMNNLEKVLVIPTSSYDESYIRKFLMYELKQIKNIKVINNQYGIIATKNNNNKLSPLFCSHLDTVHDIPEKYTIQKHILRNDIFYTSKYGIGGDDKCGIYVCLELLKKMDNIKVCFFSQEEIGCIGSSNIDISYFDNINMVIGIDRRYNSDLITNYIYSRINDDCYNTILPIANKYKYKQTSGMITDAFTIAERLNLNSINLSCGYYNPHTLDEYVSANDVNKCLELCYQLNKLNMKFNDMEFEDFSDYYQGFYNNKTKYIF